MTTQDQIESIAADLFAAYTSKEPIQPPREIIEDMTVADAYAIQQWQEKAFEAKGDKVVGRKIGLTSLAMQKQLGVDSPDFGFFTESLLFSSDEAIAVDQFISPKVEPELGFKLAKDLAPNSSFEEVLNAIESVHLAIEIIDSRVRDWNIRLVDTVADNASCGAIVLDPEPANIPLEELTAVPARMLIGDEVTGEGTGEAVMGHPVKPIAWLTEILGEMGTTLKAGDIILSGSFCGAAPVVAGQEVIVDYGSYGTLTTSFK